MSSGWRQELFTLQLETLPHRSESYFVWRHGQLSLLPLPDLLRGAACPQNEEDFLQGIQQEIKLNQIGS